MHKTLNNIPAVVLIAVVKRRLGELACRKGGNGTVDVFADGIGVEFFIGRIDSKPFRKNICLLLAVEIFLNNRTGLLKIRYAAVTVRKIKTAGYRVALATNPLFPSFATESRIRWAGLQPEDFELYTTYENSRFCKPNPAYYQAVVDALGVKPNECLMVGNDASDDVAAEELGMRVFLLTDCLINQKGADLSGYPQGGFADLLRYLKIDG